MRTRLVEQIYFNGDKQQRPLRLRYQSMLFMAGRILPSTALRMVYPFLGVFGRGMGVGLAAISLTVAARELTGLLTPFLAVVADRIGRKAGMLFGVALFIIGSALMVIWPTYTAFFISMCIIVLGTNIYMPAMFAYLGDKVPYRKRGFVMGLVETSWALSFLVGVPLVGLLIERRGWASPFPIFAGLGVLVFVLLMWFIPATARQSEPSGTGALWSNLHEVLKLKSVRAVLLACLAFGIAIDVFALVFGVWLEDSHGMQIAALGGAAALIGFAEMGGELSSGWVSDRIGKGRSIILGMAVSALAALVLPWIAGSVWGSLAGLFLFFLAAEFSLMGILIMATEIVPSSRATMIGTSMGVLSVGLAVGAYLSPLLYEWGGFRANTYIAVLLAAVSIFALRRIDLRNGTGQG